MSENQVYLITDDPNYEPSAEQRQKAIELFKQITSPCEMTLTDNKVSEKTKFIYGDYEHYICPKCHTKHDRFDDDIEALLDDKVHGSNLDSETVTMPCCGVTIKVTELKFEEGGAGFTRFDMSVYEPSGTAKYWERDDEDDEEFEDEYDDDPLPYGTELTEDASKQFADILGCPVKVVWQRM